MTEHDIRYSITLRMHKTRSYCMASIPLNDTYSEWTTEQWHVPVPCFSINHPDSSLIFNICPRAIQKTINVNTIILSCIFRKAVDSQYMYVQSFIRLLQSEWYYWSSKANPHGGFSSMGSRDLEVFRMGFFTKYKIIGPSLIMTPHGNVFRFTDPLWRQPIGERWISLTKAQ